VQPAVAFGRGHRDGWRQRCSCGHPGAEPRRPGYWARNTLARLLNDSRLRSFASVGVPACDPPARRTPRHARRVCQASPGRQGGRTTATSTQSSTRPSAFAGSDEPGEVGGFNPVEGPGRFREAPDSPIHTARRPTRDRPYSPGDRSGTLLRLPSMETLANSPCQGLHLTNPAVTARSWVLSGQSVAPHLPIIPGLPDRTVCRSTVSERPLPPGRARTVPRHR
jgi:hypothetical protein